LITKGLFSAGVIYTARALDCAVASGEVTMDITPDVAVD
jgi:hypothetical protein